MMKRLLALVLIGLMMTGTALADCADHGYAPLRCPGTADDPPAQLCLDCGAHNPGSQACPDCGGDGMMPCTSGVCEGGQRLWGTVQCEACNGVGRNFSTGRDCPYCELGFNWIYEDCPRCIAGTEFCLIIRQRVAACSECGGTNLRCLLCMDEPTVPPCPDCEPEAYAPFRYRTVMRDPQGHLGGRFRVTGVVQETKLLQEMDGGKVIRLTLQEADDAAGVTYTYQVNYFAPSGAMNLLMGDRLDLWCVLAYTSGDNTPWFCAYRAALLE